MPLIEREDSFQALGIFSDENPWNALPLAEPPATIVDLGANRGLSTLYWRSRFPDAAVHGVEMNADNIRCCREIFATNRLEATFHQFAISDHDGTLSFRSHSSHTRHRLSSLIASKDEPYNYDSQLIEVPSLSLLSFFSKIQSTRVDLLKIDIEGAEQFLLETISEWGPHVDLMLLEIHHNIDPVWAMDTVKNSGFDITNGDSQHRLEWWCRRN